MSVAIKIPDIGTTVNIVTLVRWLKKEGDYVNRGDFLCDIETDKATSELESIAEGTILKILVSEGMELEQGTIIAYIGNQGETIPDIPIEPATREQNQSGDSLVTPNDTRNIPPLLRNLAKNYGIDLETISGTGPGGRITREDVIYAKDKNETVPKNTSAGNSLTSNQAIIARRVVQSQREIPAIHLECKINMSALLKKRQVTLEETGLKICFDAFFIEIIAKTIIRFPRFKGVIPNEKMAESDQINIGIAISHQTELYVPVIHSADRKTIAEINREILQFSLQAKEGRFTRQELSGAIFSISNLGMFPVRSFQAIIPPDQASILSVGTIEETPIVNDNRVVIAPIAIFTLSVDHKLINGREAAEFLAFMKTEIEKI